MADVTPGGEFRLPTAGEWNGWEAARRDFETRRKVSKPNNQQTHRFSDNRIRIRNSSGGALPRGSVLQIAETLVESQNPPDGAMVDGIIPDGSCSCYAIVRYHMTADEINEAHTTGIALALVDVLDTSHTRAGVINGSTTLESGPDGQYEILSPLGSTGEQEVWVATLHPCGQGDSEIFWPQLTECLQPGDEAAAVLNGTEVTVTDPYNWNFGLPGERLPVHATGGGRGCGLANDEFRVIGSHGLMRLVEITSESPLACFDTGNAKPLHTIDGFSSPECEIEVTNMSCDTMETGDAGLAFYDHSSETWRILSKGKPKVAHATLGEDMCADDETASIAAESEVAIDCCCGDLSVSSADNPFSLSGESGDLVELQKNCNGGWYVRQVLHGSETVAVYDAEAADCEKIKTRQISAMWCEDQGDPITSTATVLADARINDDCDFQVQPISICVLSASEPEDYVTRKAALERRYVDTLARDGDDLLVGMSKVKVFCTGSRVDDVIPLCCDGDPPSSSDPADCVECGENLINSAIGLSLHVTLGAVEYEWTGSAEHDGSVWQIVDDGNLNLFDDGVPTEIAVSGSVSCVDGDLVAAITLTQGAETHEYTFTIAMAENEGGTHLVGEETQNELGDVPVHNPAACSGEDNGTTVAHCGNNDDYLCFTFTPPAENVSFNVRIYDCEGNEIWGNSSCGNSFGENLDPRTQQTTLPVLAGIGTDWVVVIDWYEYPGGCTNLLRTDTIPGPDAGENCGGGGNCTIRLHISSAICEGASSVTGPFFCEGTDPAILDLANFVRHASLPGGEVDIDGFQWTGISCNRYKFSDNGAYNGSHTYDIAIDGVESLCLIEVSCWCGDVPDGPHQIMIRILTITGETQTAAQSEWQDASGGPPWQLEITQVGLLSGSDVLDALLGLIFEVDNT